jgi:hypothetical protein
MPICTENLQDGFPKNPTCIVPMILFYIFPIALPIELIISAGIGALIGKRNSNERKNQK